MGDSALHDVRERSTEAMSLVSVRSDPLHAFVRKLLFGLGWAWHCTCPDWLTPVCHYRDQPAAYAAAFAHMRTHLVQGPPYDWTNTPGRSWCRWCGYEIEWTDRRWYCWDGCERYQRSWHLPDPNARGDE